MLLVAVPSLWWQPWRSCCPVSQRPYDLAGGTVAAANPFNIETLTDGEHTLTALIDRSGSLADVTVSATFTVDNHQVVFSTEADRSNPAPLDGATVAGDLFVFAAPERPSINRVDWFLDDPDMTGQPYQVETSAPWDFERRHQRRRRPLRHHPPARR